MLKNTFSRVMLYKSNRMSVCLFVPKDLANRWTDMVLLYSKASPRPLLCRFINILGDDTNTLSKEIALEKNNPSPKNVLFKTKY